MKVLITGAQGFVAKNLIAFLRERQDVEVLEFSRGDSISSLNDSLLQADFVFHLAGVNRPQSPEDFKTGNTDLTRAVCDGIAASGRRIPLLYSSSSQAALTNAYGESKLGAEQAVVELAAEHGIQVHIFRLPNVFGKWARPNYNSAVATFCHNIARHQPIQINTPDAAITLAYIDDVISQFYYIHIMFDNQDRISFINQFFNDFHQNTNVFKMQACCGFIQDVKRVSGIFFR